MYSASGRPVLPELAAADDFSAPVLAFEDLPAEDFRPEDPFAGDFVAEDFLDDGFAAEDVFVERFVAAAFVADFLADAFLAPLAGLVLFVTGRFTVRLRVVAMLARRCEEHAGNGGRPGHAGVGESA